MGIKRKMLVLTAAAAAACALSFAPGTSLAPEPLSAQLACGAFAGNKCQDHCTETCPNGSCCNMWYYYYEKVAVDN